MPTLARMTKCPLHHSLKTPLILSEGAAGYQDQPAIPSCNELFPGQQVGAPAATGRGSCPRPWRPPRTRRRAGLTRSPRKPSAIMAAYQSDRVVRSQDTGFFSTQRLAQAIRTAPSEAAILSTSFGFGLATDTVPAPIPTKMRAARACPALSSCINMAASICRAAAM